MVEQVKNNLMALLTIFLLVFFFRRTGGDGHYANTILATKLKIISTKQSLAIAGAVQNIYSEPPALYHLHVPAY